MKQALPPPPHDESAITRFVHENVYLRASSAGVAQDESDIALIVAIRRLTGW